MGIVTPKPLWWRGEDKPKPQYLLDIERQIYESKTRMEEWKRESERRKERERKALYLIAEKLGIDINSL